MSRAEKFRVLVFGGSVCVVCTHLEVALGDALGVVVRDVLPLGAGHAVVMGGHADGALHRVGPGVTDRRGRASGPAVAGTRWCVRTARPEQLRVGGGRRTRVAGRKSRNKSNHRQRPVPWERNERQRKTGSGLYRSLWNARVVELGGGDAGDDFHLAGAVQEVGRDADLALESRAGGEVAGPADHKPCMSTNAIARSVTAAGGGGHWPGGGVGGAHQ